MKDRKIYVYCSRCGQVELTDGEYFRQLGRANAGWYCPNCRQPANWKGIYHACLVPECDGWVSEDEPDCPVCGTCQEQYWYKHREDSK